MKKLQCLLGAAMFVVVSCSNDDNDSSDSTPPVSAHSILLKKITEFESGKPVTRDIVYNGNKIVSFTYTDGSKDIYSYTGDFITKMEQIDEKGALNVSVEYTYVNGKLATAMENYPNETFYFKTIYIHNIDGTISYEESRIINPGEVVTGQTTGKLTFKEGNVVKDERLYTCPNYSTNSVEIYEYDTKNNPYKNIVGIGLLFDIKKSANNVIRNVMTSISGDTIYTSTITYTYKYDVNNYPTERVRVFPSGKTETYKYSY